MKAIVNNDLPSDNIKLEKIVTLLNSINPLELREQTRRAYSDL